MHLIAWDTVCSSKSEGGLALRKAVDMNKALISKLGWRLLNDKNSLWARIVRSKYKMGDVREVSWLIPKGMWSPLWRSINTGLIEIIGRGLQWILGDGRTVNFWSDKWLMGEALIDSVLGHLPEELASLKARELWREEGGWDNERILQFLLEQRQLELQAVVVDATTGARDRLSWGASEDGEFTVKSAYALLTRDETPRVNMEKLYHRVWRVIAPERVSIFIWLVCHRVIMTNTERCRRHLSASANCTVCRGGEETIIHILRDCPAMQGIWLRIIPRQQHQTFFSLSLLEWVYQNLSETRSIADIELSTLFAMGIWWAWKWRCANVFGETHICRDRTQFVKSRAKEVLDSHAKLGLNMHKRVRVAKMIGWEAPRPDWFKLISDGASQDNPGLASAGSVLKNNLGEWCGGFALNIGRCSALLAELWGVYYGLCVAWDRGVTRLDLVVDSEIVVGFLTKGIGDSRPLSFLVRLCHGFLARDWIVHVSHVYRETNRLADGLANYALSLHLISYQMSLMFFYEMMLRVKCICGMSAYNFDLVFV